jgi:hypothetical protein
MQKVKKYKIGIETGLERFLWNNVCLTSGGLNW